MSIRAIKLRSNLAVVASLACLLLCAACAEREATDAPVSDDGGTQSSTGDSGDAERFAADEPGAGDDSAGHADGTGDEGETESTFSPGHEPPSAASDDDTRAQDSPLATVESYLAAMAAHDASPDLDLYTPATREMLARHAVTRAQMDALVRAYGRCPDARISEQGRHAVVDHPGDEAGCAPWFLEQDAHGLWRLDLLPMQRAIRFDTSNRWRIADPEALGSYRFAFPAD